MCLHGSRSWLRCSYVGVGDIPGMWERHTQEENTPFSPPNPGVHFQPPALQSSQTHLASWVQQHVDVLGCLQPTVGWVTALQTAGQRAAACSKFCSLGTQTFYSPAGCAEMQEACQPSLCLGRSWDRQKTEPLPYLRLCSPPPLSPGAKTVPAPGFAVQRYHRLHPTPETLSVSLQATLTAHWVSWVRGSTFTPLSLQSAP